MAARLTAAQARQLQLDGTVASKPSKRGRREASGPYHTVCAYCAEHFTTKASEDRHVGAGHTRFELVLSFVEPV